MINVQFFSWRSGRSKNTAEKPPKNYVDINYVCWLIRSCNCMLSPEGGTLHAGLDVILVLSSRFGDQVSLALLQTSPLCCLLLLGELLPHFLTHNLLQHKQHQQVILLMESHCTSNMFKKKKKNHVEILKQSCQDTTHFPQNWCYNYNPANKLFCATSRKNICFYIDIAMKPAGSLLTGGIVEQLPVLPMVASLSVLLLLCSAICWRLSESLKNKQTKKGSQGMHGLLPIPIVFFAVRIPSSGSQAPD